MFMMSVMEKIYIISALSIFVFMNLMYLLALRLKDNSIVDIGWGIGFIIVAITTLFISGDLYPRQLLVTSIVIVWGLRLAIYIFIRNRGRGEDYRYRQWREQWGKNIYWRSYLQVFMLQGFLLFVIALPVIRTNFSDNRNLTVLDGIGFVIWLTGFLFEAIGDYQMMRFKSDPANKGMIMRHGLWKYTRHPNYFGEALLWWGVFIISIGAGSIYVSVLSPIVLTWLLLKVSGVAMLEKKYTGNKEYDDYIGSTSSFIPMPPKR